MIRNIIIICLLGATSLAAQIPIQEVIPIVKQDFSIEADGSYSSSYQTGNGISAYEQGHIKNPGTDNEISEVQGGSEYTAPDGTVISLKYTANEGGFQAQGAHLPTPPPTQEIPPAILRSLEYNAAHPDSDAKKSS